MSAVLDRAAPRVRTLGRRGVVAVGAATAGLGLWVSGAPSMLYPSYIQQWGLSSSTTTLVFAIYPLTLVIVLTLFGNVADHIGRRAAILVGLAGMLLGTLAFALAPSLAWLFAGRVLMGIGVGFAFASATALLVEFAAPGKASGAAGLTNASTATGVGIATIIAGALVQYAPDKLHLSYWVLVAVIVVVGVAALGLPRHTRADDAGPWRIQGPHVPRALLRHYLPAAIATSLAFAVGGTTLSLGAQIATTLIDSSNALVSGLVLAIMAAVFGTTGIVARRFPTRRVILVGAVTAIVGAVALEAAGLTHSLPLFLITQLLAGVAYGCLFTGGVGEAALHAPARHRAGLLSAVYLAAYVTQGALTVVLGVIATGAGLATALLVATATVVVMSALAVLLVAASRRGSGAVGD